MQQDGPAHNQYSFHYAGYAAVAAGPVQFTADEWQHVAVVFAFEESARYGRPVALEWA